MSRRLKVTKIYGNWDGVFKVGEIVTTERGYFEKVLSNNATSSFIMNPDRKSISAGFGEAVYFEEVSE